MAWLFPAQPWDDPVGQTAAKWPGWIKTNGMTLRACQPFWQIHCLAKGQPDRLAG